MVLGFLGIAGVTGAASERVLREWTFERAGDLEGWRANAGFTNGVVAGGAFHARAVGSDPILELTAPFEVAATPWQFLEVRMRASEDGVAEWFWSRTAEGRYGGFTQEKTTRFRVRGGEDWRTWRVFPFWQAEQRIVRLRFDLYDGAAFELDSIRLGELEMPPVTGEPQFVFNGTNAGWQVVGGGRAVAEEAGLAVALEGTDAFLLAPPVEFAAEQRSFVSLEMAVDRGRHGTVLFATRETPGLQRFTFPLEPGGSLTTYNLDLLGARDWRGGIVALGLVPSDELGAAARVRRFRADAFPHGPAQPRVAVFAPQEALLRAGRPIPLRAQVVNRGAEMGSNWQATLLLPPGLRLASGGAATQSAPPLGFDEEAGFVWSVIADAPGEAVVRLRMEAPGLEPAETVRSLRFAPDPGLPRATRVPEPQPVRGPTEVGAYYFPGWRSAGQWQPIRHFPERRPALGWYREGDPEVADWQIKWAVEHGITFFAYDWYWSQGARQLEHGLHEGYFRAQYRHLLKFCLLWANHNAPGTHSAEDCVAVTQYWIANYFRRPEHLRIDGQPVMILFSPQRLTEDLGSDGVRRAFTLMREECRRAGLPGLYLVACVGEAGEARRAVAEGYDAITAYNWAGLGMAGDSLYGPFATLIEGYHRQWRLLADQCPLPLIPPLSGGWDSRPWHGENQLVRFGRTPDLFRQHLVAARRFLEGRRRTNAVPDLVLVEAWNEWGEGSYIEPHQEFGFGYLDAIRDVFTPALREHLDLVPADVGLGPYDVAADPPGRHAWSFDVTDEGWGDGMNLGGVTVESGVLTACTTSGDAAFFGPPLQLAAGEFKRAKLRLKLTPRSGGPFEDQAQLFWRTSRMSESEATSVRFRVQADGEWHDYEVPLGTNLRWRGIVTRLRLDPVSRAGVEVRLDEFRLVR